MKTILLILATAAVIHAQNRYDPRQAAILSEQRYLTGDGSFGTEYKQEDGTNFKEETDAYGNRKGSYSYVDASGQKRTISYTAGKDGFMATGDHLPQPHVPPPQYIPDPKYNSPQYQEPQEYVQPQYRPQATQYQQQPDQYQPQTQYKPQSLYQPPQSQYQYKPPTQYQPQQQPQYQPQYQPPSQSQYYSTTPAPHRFYPPGKLSLQRSPDGFSYSFNKA